VYRYALLLPALFFLSIPVLAQQPPANATAQKPSPYASIPVEATREQNPVKASPESIGRAKKWWTLDCAMCHGASGDGKGDIAKDMKLNVADFTNANTLKDRADGEIYYIIKNGHNDMPAEGPRIKPAEGWDLVNYVRSLAKGKDTEAKQQ
jgi:mono/diheme cytochrome c family protein